jgi:predicted DNA-binding transcriptional regulator AlpA
LALFGSANFVDGPLVNLDPLLEQLADLVAEKVAARLNGKAPSTNGEGNGNGEPLLTAEAVAKQLGTSARWVYDHADELGGKRLSPRCLRFPDAAVRRYVERHR